jgi:hypothetical protein
MTDPTVFPELGAFREDPRIDMPNDGAYPIYNSLDALREPAWMLHADGGGTRWVFADLDGQEQVTGTDPEAVLRLAIGRPYQETFLLTNAAALTWLAADPIHVYADWFPALVDDGLLTLVDDGWPRYVLTEAGLALAEGLAA